MPHPVVEGNEGNQSKRCTRSSSGTINSSRDGLRLRMNKNTVSVSSNKSVANTSSELQTRKPLATKLRNDTITRRRISASLTPQVSPRTRSSRSTKENANPEDTPLTKITKRKELPSFQKESNSIKHAELQSQIIKTKNVITHHAPVRRNNRYPVSTESSSSGTLSADMMLKTNLRRDLPHNRGKGGKTIDSSTLKSLPETSRALTTNTSYRQDVKTIASTKCNSSRTCSPNSVSFLPSGDAQPLMPPQMPGGKMESGNQEDNRLNVVPEKKCNVDKSNLSPLPPSIFSISSSPSKLLVLEKPVTLSIDQVLTRSKEEEGISLESELSDTSCLEVAPISSLISEHCFHSSTRQEVIACDLVQSDHVQKGPVCRKIEGLGEVQASVQLTEDLGFQVETPPPSVHSEDSGSDFSTYFKLDESEKLQGSSELENLETGINNEQSAFCDSSSSSIQEIQTSVSSSENQMSSSKAKVCETGQKIPTKTPEAGGDIMVQSTRENNVIYRLLTLASAYIPIDTSEISIINNKYNNVFTIGTSMKSGAEGVGNSSNSRKSPQAARIADELAALRSGSWANLGSFSAGSVLARARAFGSTIWTPGTIRDGDETIEENSNLSSLSPRKNYNSEYKSNLKEGGVFEAESGPNVTDSSPIGRDTVRRRNSLRSVAARKNFILAKDLV